MSEQQKPASHKAFRWGAVKEWSTWLVALITSALTLLVDLPQWFADIVVFFGGDLPGMTAGDVLRWTRNIAGIALVARFITQKWVTTSLMALLKRIIDVAGTACARLHFLLEGDDKGAVRPKTAGVAAGIGMVLALSTAGANFLIEREGYKLQAYRDPIGIWTICAGHTGEVVIAGVRYGPVRAGMKLTFEQCRTLLHQDSEVARQGLNRCVKRQLGQNQSNSLISFAVNVGPAGACSSVVVQRINAGDMNGAAAAFVNWSYVTLNGKKVPMLRPRRELEAALFLKPDNDNMPWDSSDAALKRIAKAGTARGGL